MLPAEDNVELRRLYEDVEAQQQAIQRQMFLGELRCSTTSVRLLDATHEPLERDRIQAAVHDVATRLQDLHTMEEVHVQYFVSIELTRNNNHRLGQAVDRTLALATNVVTIGLAIQAALSCARPECERRPSAPASSSARWSCRTPVPSADRPTRSATSTTSPSSPWTSCVQAHHDLLAALDTASRLREDGIHAARQNIRRGHRSDP